jgi:ligand-binding sensor domain-containing protein/DNA-binding CsgD family transcriptional regulator
MHFIKFLISCPFIALLNLSAIAQIGLPLVKNFSPDDYKGGIQNWQITQDKSGMLYVANNLGLLQYDGNNWETHTVLGASKLRSISIGGTGRIYAGYQDDFGFFEADSIGWLNYHSLKYLIPEKYKNIGETWKTYIINNEVYFCTFSFIYIFDGASIKVIEYSKNLDVSYNSGSDIYTYIPQQGLSKLKNYELVPLPYATYFADKTVSGVVSLNSQELLIATARDGLFKADQYTVKPWYIDLNELFSETFINCIKLLSNGNIAIGTQHNGIYLVDQKGTILLHMNKERGLLSRTILSLFEDQNQNLWVGQNNGISFIELKSPFRIINEEIGLPGTGYSALKKDNQLYLGTNNGLFLEDHKGMNLIPGTEGQVYNIQSVNTDILISHNNGAYLYKDTIVTPIDLTIGTWAFILLKKKLFQGTYEGINVLNPDNYSKVGEFRNLKESSRILISENDSTIWMSHAYKGLYRIQIDENDIPNARIEFYNKSNGLPTDLYNTAQIIEGKLKISTQDGIYSYNSKHNTFIKDSLLSSYLADDFISSMKSDIYGNLYFITQNTVGFLEKINSNEYIKHISAFNPIRKLLNDDLPNINLIGSNSVLFGAKEGFVNFDRNLFWTTENEQFNTIIRQVKYSGQETAILYAGNNNPKYDNLTAEEDSFPKISYDNNTISFFFSSTSFNSTLNPEFQYKLLGYDKDWNDWTENNFKEYTNLKEGFYTFQVKSRNANHLESDIVSYSLIIIYPWYRSPLAYIIYVILGISLLVGLVYSLDKRHQLEKKKLEQRRLEEIKEKEEHIDSITRKSSDEINQLKHEKLESEIKHINTELATSTMHLLTKNEFINDIKATLGGVVKKSKNVEVKSQIVKIIKNIEANIKTDADWDNFLIHFDKVHGDFSSRIKKEFPALSPQEIKLSTYLRLNLSTKEIADLLNISVRGVEIGRYRLRKKLFLERTQNLVEFILNY